MAVRNLTARFMDLRNGAKSARGAHRPLSNEATSDSGLLEVRSQAQRKAEQTRTLIGVFSRVVSVVCELWDVLRVPVRQAGRRVVLGELVGHEEHAATAVRGQDRADRGGHPQDPAQELVVPLLSPVVCVFWGSFVVIRFGIGCCSRLQ